MACTLYNVHWYIGLTYSLISDHISRQWRHTPRHCRWRTPPHRPSPSPGSAWSWTWPCRARWSRWRSRTPAGPTAGRSQRQNWDVYAQLSSISHRNIRILDDDNNWISIQWSIKLDSSVPDSVSSVVLLVKPLPDLLCLVELNAGGVLT